MVGAEYVSDLELSVYSTIGRIGRVVDQVVTLRLSTLSLSLSLVTAFGRGE